MMLKCMLEVPAAFLTDVTRLDKPLEWHVSFFLPITDVPAESLVKKLKIRPDDRRLLTCIEKEVNIARASDVRTAARMMKSMFESGMVKVLLEGSMREDLNETNTSAKPNWAAE